MNPAIVIVGVGLYTIVMFAIGYWGFSKVRPTMEDFFLGGRTLGLFVITCTVWSTLFSAYTYIGLPGAYYRTGISFFGVAGNVVLNSICMYFLGTRMWALGKKRGYINATDLLADRYGSNLVCGLAVLISIASLLPYLGAQIKGAGLTLQGVTNNVIPLEMGILYVTIVVLAYVVLGGFRSVVWTDVIQTVIMLVGLLGAMWIIADRVAGGLPGVIQKAAAISPNLVQFPGPTATWVPTMILTQAIALGVGGFAWPQISQRMYATKSLKTVKTLAFIFPIAALFANVPVIFLGLAGRIQYPNIQNPDTIMPTMLSELVPPVFAIIVVLAIMAAIMSTVSGMMLSLTSIVVRDLWVRFFEPESATEARITNVSRLALVVIVAGALAFVFWGPSTLVGYLIDASGPIMLQVVAVLFGALYWRRATKEGAIASMVVSELFFLCLWQKWIVMPAWGIHNAVWAMVVGWVLFIAVSLVTKPQPKEMLDEFYSPFEPEKPKERVPA